MLISGEMDSADYAKLREKTRLLRDLRKQFWQEFQDSRKWGQGSFEDWLIRELDAARQPEAEIRKRERTAVLLNAQAIIARLLLEQGVVVDGLPQAPSPSQSRPQDGSHQSAPAGRSPQKPAESPQH